MNNQCFYNIEVLSVNQQLSRIRVVEVDVAKGKVGLSLKE
jgi:protein Tex